MSSESSTSKDAISQLTSLLETTWRIKIDSGRVFVGKFMVVDREVRVALSLYPLMFTQFNVILLPEVS